MTMLDHTSATPGGPGTQLSRPVAEGLLCRLEAHFLGLLAAIALLALTLRVIALFALQETPYFHYLMMDERIYHDWARQIADGTYAPRAAYEFPPLPAYLIALIYRLLSPNPLYTRLLNIVLGTFTCVLIGLTGRRLDRPVTGLSAALLAALYKPLVFYSVVPLKTALSVFLCAAVVYLLCGLCQRPTRYRCLVLGLLIGLAVNVRGNYLVLAPVAALAIFRTYGGKPRPLHRLVPALLLFGAGLLLAVAPFAIRNYKVSGEWVLTTTQAGFNFYLGNNLHNPTPYSRPVAFAASSPFLQGVQFTIEAARREGRPLTAAEASRFWTREVFREAAEQPRAFAEKQLYKLLAPINRYENCDHYDLGFLSGFIPFLRLPFPTFTLIWPFGFAGMVMETLKFRRSGWPAAVFGAYLLTLVLFFTNGRYRLPLLTVLIPFAAVAASRIGAALSARRLRLLAAYLSLSGLGLTLTLVPVPGADDWSRYYNFHGIVLESSGNLPAAMRCWRRSAAMGGSASPFAALMLAERAAARKDYHEAELQLAAIPDDSYAAALKYALRGDLAAAEGRLDAAVAAYERSLAVNSGQPAVRRKLFRLLERLDPDAADRQEAILDRLKHYYRGL